MIASFFIFRLRLIYKDIVTVAYIIWSIHGVVMKKTRGKATPKEVNEIILRMIKKNNLLYL